MSQKIIKSKRLKLNNYQPLNWETALKNSAKHLNKLTNKELGGKINFWYIILAKSVSCDRHQTKTNEEINNEYPWTIASQKFSH